LAKVKALKTQRFNLFPPGKKATLRENFPWHVWCVLQVSGKAI
jgi:hypothetical protein